MWRLYKELGNVAAVAAAVGRHKSTVHERLQKAGYRLNSFIFSADEIAQIKDYYLNTKQDDFDLSELAERLGRARHLVCRKAGEIGLTDKRRKASKDGRANIKAAAEGRWKRIPHPRGMLGKTHSDEYKREFGARVKLKWATDKAFGIGYMSEENRQKRSDNSLKIAHNRPASNNYSRSKSGRRDDLGGLFVRSSWEANYARYLNFLMKLKIVSSWEYEPETFWFENIKRGVRSYKPDFRVIYSGSSDPVFVEIKGWFDAKSKTKMKRMKKYYPEVKIEFVGAKEYRAIERKWKGAINGWE